MHENKDDIFVEHTILNQTLETSTESPLEALLGNDATLKGLEELLERISPLIAGGRLNRLIDLASVASDLVDMTDAYMVEKLAKAFDDTTGAAWTVGNAARMAQAEVADLKEPPSLMGLLRIAREPDVRRGLAFFLVLAGVLGKGMQSPPDYNSD